jgi:hypothetical protein
MLSFDVEVDGVICRSERRPPLLSRSVDDRPSDSISITTFFDFYEIKNDDHDDDDDDDNNNNDEKYRYEFLSNQ